MLLIFSFYNWNIDSFIQVKSCLIGLNVKYLSIFLKSVLNVSFIILKMSKSCFRNINRVLSVNVLVVALRRSKQIETSWHWDRFMVWTCQQRLSLQLCPERMARVNSPPGEIVMVPLSQSSGHYERTIIIIDFPHATMGTHNMVIMST